MFVSCECCLLLQVEVSATGRSEVQGNPTAGVCVCVCVLVCDHMKEDPSTPKMARYKEIELRKKERNIASR
jgi:hypothetical protein